MNTCVRLLVHGVSAETWTKRYGIEPLTYPCHGCGRPLTTTIPFRQGQLVGLTAPKCECGEHKDPSHPDGSRSLPPYVLMRDPKCGDLLDEKLWGR
jgi:hypothetical protein